MPGSAVEWAVQHMDASLNMAKDVVRHCLR